MADRTTSGSPPAEYGARLKLRRHRLGATEALHRRWGLVRLGILAALVAIGYAAWARGALSAWWLLLPVAAFLFVGRIMSRNETLQAGLRRAIRLYERGLERLADRWEGVGPTGVEFLDHDHPYARDLDLFGTGSLFQLLCAARTGLGRQRLAHWLLEPAARETIGGRQEAVEELAADLDFREALSVTGDDVGDAIHPDRLAGWGTRPPALDLSPASRALVRIGAVVGLVAVAAVFVHLAAQMGLVSLGATTLAAIRLGVAATFLVLAAVTWRTRTATVGVLHGVEEAARELGLLADLLALVEEADHEAPLLAGLRQDIGPGEVRPSGRIARLGRLMQLVDSRDNFLVRLFGVLVLWDLQLGLAIESWRRESGPALADWMRIVGEHEALASLARYRYERPGTRFPELVEEGPLFEAEGLGHPLLPTERLVRNDVAIGDAPHVLIVSGSNMSGKSTLLRTVGVAAVVAQAGGPVRARRLRMSRLVVGASIRLQDSLREGTSRFYAEILRLRSIVELAASEPHTLFLIDEFLHGTNSHDRRAGADAIVRGLVERDAIGLITTHDLALTGIADALGDAGRNVHFADELVDGRMHFDYRLRDGVVRKSNAIELMRSIGLDV